MKDFRYIAVLAVLGACAGHKAPAGNPMAPVTTSDHKDIRWFRASAEYRGLALQIYRDAAAHLAENARASAPRSWAVILDADETILDNSLNERELVDRHQTYSETGWTAWVRRRAATAIPGAVEFARQVHALGGRVAIVTNRADSLCAPTKENIRAIGIDADMVLCKQGAIGDKNPRFESIEHGTAAAGIGPLLVVEWIGDNILDFPKLSQDVRKLPNGYTDFGVHYFLLPNPMYGSWEKNVEP